MKNVNRAPRISGLSQKGKPAGRMFAFDWSDKGLRINIEGKRPLKNDFIQLVRPGNYFAHKMPTGTMILTDKSGFASGIVFEKDTVYKGVPADGGLPIFIYKDGCPKACTLPLINAQLYYVFNNVRFEPGTAIQFHKNGAVAKGTIAQEVKCVKPPKLTFAKGSVTIFDESGRAIDRDANYIVITRFMDPLSPMYRGNSRI
jgi:hypothetical protein